MAKLVDLLFFIPFAILDGVIALQSRERSTGFGAADQEA